MVFGCILENALENPFLSCFSHFLSFQTNISSNPTKPKFIKTQILNTQQKKIHQIRDQPKIREQQNENHPRHHNNNKKIRDQREQADRRFGGMISGLTNGEEISGFATIGDEWVWRFLGLRFEEWVRRRDLSLSLSLCLRV